MEMTMYKNTASWRITQNFCLTPQYIQYIEKLNQIH